MKTRYVIVLCFFGLVLIVLLLGIGLTLNSFTASFRASETAFGSFMVFLLQFLQWGLVIAGILAFAYVATHIYARLHWAQYRELTPTAEGNYPALVSPRRTMVIEAGNGPVPGSYHFHQEVEYAAPKQIEAPQTTVEEIAQAVQPPTIESIVAQLPYNELMTAYGVTLKTGKLITANIPEAVHFKLVGGSGFGKSCEAAALLRIATLSNDHDHLQIALLDLEHKTSRLFENLPHVAEIRAGRKVVSMAMDSPSADEVAHKLAALVGELQRRAEYGIETPVLLIYVEEMLSLQYEVDESLLNNMLANLAILAVRGRKYGMFLEACTQADYSTKELKVAQKQFRSRIAFAIDTAAARASGFLNTELIKKNFQTGLPGQFVLEMPGFSEIMVAPQLDVKQELRRLEVGTSNRGYATSRPTTGPMSGYRHSIVTGSLDRKRREVDFDSDDFEQEIAVLPEKSRRVAELIRQHKGQNEIISEVWGISGGGRAYQEAVQEYRAILAQLLEGV